MTEIENIIGTVFDSELESRREPQTDIKLRQTEPRTSSSEQNVSKKTIYLQRISNEQCLGEAVLIDDVPKFLIAKYQ
jgi:hypothetical protein